MGEQVKLPYYDKELERASVEVDSNYDEIIEVLTDPRIIELAKAGELSLAMIKPNVGPEANLKGLPDAECAELIEDMIKGLGVVTKFSFKFTDEAVELFYGGTPKENMKTRLPDDPTKYESKWEEYKDFMTSGATTALLLHSPDGDAIEKWRSYLGHWDINKFRDPSTIRGQLAANVCNNLVHGSDSPESVVKELKIISDILMKHEDSDDESY